MNQESRETRAALETQISSLQRLLCEIEAEDTPTTNRSAEPCLRSLKIILLNELIRRAQEKLNALND